MRNRGFTLMEMLVALVIGAIIITPLYIITRGMTRQTDLQRLEIESAQRARVGESVLLADFAKAGLHASPSPLEDPRSLCFGLAADQNVCPQRLAVVHLNRQAAGNDSVILVGNFLGAKLYSAHVFGNSFVIDELDTTTEIANICAPQFNPAYSYGHVVTQTGRTWDFRISAVSNSAPCTVTAASLPEFVSLPTGSTVYLGASQAVLYRVETVYPNTLRQQDQLARYFLDYSESTDCTNPQDAIVASTRQVVANYVTNFQVWFRTTHIQGIALKVPNYLNHDEMTTNGIAEFTVDRGLNHLIQLGGGTTSDLNCTAAAGNARPFDVASAVIRLGVRTTHANQSYEYIAFGEAGIRDFALAPVTCSGAACADKPGTAYLVKTLTTEIMMPNL